MPNKMERFTQRARRVLSLAQEEAERLQHNYIGTEHLLLGLIREVSRLPSAAGDRLTSDLAPLVDRAVAYLQQEMDGALRGYWAKALDERL